MLKIVKVINVYLFIKNFKMDGIFFWGTNSMQDPWNKFIFGQVSSVVA